MLLILFMVLAATSVFAGLAFGSVIFLIAIVEKLVSVARGGAWMEDVATEDSHIER